MILVVSQILDSSFIIVRNRADKIQAHNSLLTAL